MIDKAEVLDHGYIIFHDKLGTDLTVANAARASFKKKSKGKIAASTGMPITVPEADKTLIGFLAKKDHTSPFRHCMVQYEISAPLFVARQWWKHVVGGAFYDPSTAWNESSGRYIEFDKYYIPVNFRAKPENRKQGSGGNVNGVLNQIARNFFGLYCFFAVLIYRFWMWTGICTEQARMILPQNIYVTWYWTTSLQAVFHLLSLREKPDAQWEIQRFAESLRQITEPWFPESFKSWELRDIGGR